MFKHCAAIFALMATIAFAGPATGKVLSVKGGIVVLELQGPLASWVKKGAQVKINQKLLGRITGVEGGSLTLSFAKVNPLVEGATVTLVSPRATVLKRGEKVTFDDSLDRGGF